MEGVMTAGIYTAVNSLIGKFHEPMQKILALSETIRTTEMQMQRLDDVRRYPIDSLNYPDETQKITFTGDRLSGEIQIQSPHQRPAEHERGEK